MLDFDFVFLIGVLASIVILTSHLLDEIPALNGPEPSWDFFF